MKSYNRLSLLLLWIVLLSCQPTASVDGQVAGDDNSKFAQLSQAFMEKSVVPGMAVIVYQSGNIVYSEGHGYADLEQQVPVDPLNTKFRIASISKTLTADALAQLTEAGKLNLDAEVQEYVASFPKKRWPVTTRMSAGHIAGIRHYRGDEFLSSKFYPTVLEGLDIFKNDPLLFEPTSKYSYSSYGFNLVSAVIEGASGESFLAYMSSHVFEPLEMNNTVPEYMDQIISGRGRYYYKSDDGVVNAPFVDNSYKWAGGGFLSTAEDLIKFAKAHLSAGYLSEASLTELTTSQKLLDGSETGYGLGWVTNIDKEGHHWIGHSGGAIGGTSKMVIYPEDELIVVVLTNLSGAGLGSFPHELAWEAMKN
jgi:CubicO group peptidase (beta-lactamase class C family)